MIRFIETIKFDPAFAKAVYDAFYDPEKDKLDFYRVRKIKIDGWPDNLSTENIEIESISPNSLVFVSGGDWQEMIPVTLCLKRDSCKLIWSPFDAYTKKSSAEIKNGCRDLIRCAQEQD